MWSSFQRSFRAERFDPVAWAELFRRAGAAFVVPVAEHHDGFAMYDCGFSRWTSVQMGPKRDVVGTWEKIARRAGLKFGVSNHAAHAWHWYQPAYGYDPTGPMRGVRYDAFTEMSGRMSFSLALLDDDGDGVTITAMTGRTDTRVYAKAVAGGAGEHELSPEERQAVSAALTSAKKLGKAS